MPLIQYYNLRYSICFSKSLANLKKLSRSFNNTHRSFEDVSSLHHGKIFIPRTSFHLFPLSPNPSKDGCRKWHFSLLICRMVMLLLNISISSYITFIIVVYHLTEIQHWLYLVCSKARTDGVHTTICGPDIKCNLWSFEVHSWP